MLVLYKKIFEQFVQLETYPRINEIFCVNTQTILLSYFRPYYTTKYRSFSCEICLGNDGELRLLSIDINIIPNHFYHLESNAVFTSLIFSICYDLLINLSPCVRHSMFGSSKEAYY